jgi:hypothetical protein
MESETELLNSVALMFFDTMSVGCVASEYARAVIKMVRDHDKEVRVEREEIDKMKKRIEALEGALVEICVKCRSNEWGPLTPRKEILNTLHDMASNALGG